MKTRQLTGIERTNEGKIIATISTDTPCFRPDIDAYEILAHDSKSDIDFSRAEKGLPMIYQHNIKGEIIGRIVKLHLVGKALKGYLKPGNTTRAKEVFKDINDEIITDLSVGYDLPEKHELIEKRGKNYLIFRGWTPYEVSAVFQGLDPNAKIGRNMTTSETRKEKREHLSIEYDSVQKERDRVREIIAIGESVNKRGLIHPGIKVTEVASEFIDKGYDVEQFRAYILDNLKEAKPIQANSFGMNDRALNPQGLSQTEINDFSISKLILSRAYPQKCGDIADQENEISRDLQKRSEFKNHGDFTIPHTVLMHQRALDVGTSDTAGGYLANDNNFEFVELLRNKSRVLELGANMLPGLKGDVPIPKQTSGALGQWLGETETMNEEDQSFGQVNLSPKRIGSYTVFSKQLLYQSTPEVEQLVKNDLTSAIGTAIDLAALHGSGSNNQPLGLANQTGIGSIEGGANGLAPNWGHVVELQSSVEIANADMGAMKYLTNAKIKAKLMQTEKVSGSSEGHWIWENGAGGSDGIIAGKPAYITNQVASNLNKGTSTGVCSAIFYGAWNQIYIGSWGPGIDLTIDTLTLATSAQIRIVVNSFNDIAVRYPQAFSMMLDALSS